MTTTPLKRSDIGGLSIRLLGYALELVTVRRVPNTLALSRGPKTIWRIEK